MADHCPYPAVHHPGTSIWECPDPACTQDPRNHSQVLPCRWSWPYAHDRRWGGSAFPAGHCAHCTHVRRAGKPQINTNPAAPSEHTVADKAAR